MNVVPPSEGYNGEPYVFPHFNSAYESGATEAHFYQTAGVTDRSFEQYSDAFGFNLSIFAGKCVLDLGAGVRSTFANQAQEHGLNVVSVNPCWRDQRYYTDPSSGELWQSSGKAVAAVAAVAQSLPFKDGSFDIVVSLWGIPTYLPGSKTEYRRAFQEIERVLKPDGFGIMYPIMRLTLTQPAFEEVLDECFDHYELLYPEGAPKLFVAKTVTAENESLILDLKDAMDRPTNIYF